MITRLYRIILPLSLREKIYTIFLRNTLFFFRNFRYLVTGKSIYWFYFLFSKTEKNKAWAFIGKYGVTSYPFEASLSYRDKKTEILKDDTSNLHYVLHNNKKLFFPRHMPPEEISNLYLSLILEQDIASPHRYIENYSDIQGKVLVDIGSAEGIFSLDTIEYTKEVYLFECEDYWIEALETTFAPWKDKIHIIRKYVSDCIDDSNITLDSFFYNQAEKPFFLKMDIEGAEQAALKGANKLLSENQNTSLAVCTYHKKNDAKEIEALLSKKGFKTQFTDGYLFWNNGLRKALLRAKL